MAIKGYWRMNDNGNDSIGSNNLTNVNTVGYSGGINGAAEFTSTNTNKYLYVDNGLGFVAGANNITFSALVKIEATPINGQESKTIFWLIKVNATSRFYYRLYYAMTTYTAFWFFNGTSWVNYPVTLSLDKWYHVVMTETTGYNRKIYVNSVLVCDSNGTGNDTTAVLTGVDTVSIGAGRNLPTNIDGYLKGAEDEYIIDNTVWNNAQIKNKYSYYKGFF